MIPWKKNFKFHLQVGFLGPPNEPFKLQSPLIGILSEFSSSWKVPNVGSRLWLLQWHNLSTIVNHTMKSAKLSNTICPHKCLIQCTVRPLWLDCQFTALLKVYVNDPKQSFVLICVDRSTILLWSILVWNMATFETLFIIWSYICTPFLLGDLRRLKKWPQLYKN